MNLGVGVLLLSGVVCFLLGVGAGMSRNAAPASYARDEMQYADQRLHCIGKQTPVVSGGWSTCLLSNDDPVESCPAGTMGTTWACDVILAPELP